MTDSMRIDLSDGESIPRIGLGVWQTPNGVTGKAVSAALQVGYRHVDTAAAYNNEAGVGEGVRSSGTPREAVFVTTKVWNSDHGYDRALRAVQASLRRLGFDYIDLVLIHWPAPRRDLYLDTWRALIRAKEDGLVRSIGVSNFDVEHLDRIIGETGVTPVINQIEVHPRFQQRRLREANMERGIRTESWSPLGQGTVLGDPLIARIAGKHRRTPAQVIVRWHLDNGLVVIPKSANPARIKQNYDVFGFELDAEDLAVMERLDGPDGRVGPDPMTASF